jgi:hypothetical protein
VKERHQGGDYAFAVQDTSLSEGDDMRRRGLVLIGAVLALTLLFASPAMAATNYCSYGKVTWQKSNSATAQLRHHNYRNASGGTWYIKQHVGTGWKANSTGFEDATHSYSADQPVTSYYAYCLNGPV